MGDHLDMSELLELFLEEAGEQLQRMDEGILALEQNPDDLDVVNEIFRAAHTLKGSSATMGLEQIASLTHSMENLFDRFRAGSQPVTAEAVDALLAAVDVLRELLQQCQTGSSTAIPIDEVLEALKLTSDSESAAPGDSACAATDSSNTCPDGCMRIEIRFAADCAMPQVRAFIVFNTLDGKGEVVHSEPAQDEIDQLQPGCLLIVDFKPCVSRDEILASLQSVCEIEVTIQAPSDQSAGPPALVSLDDVVALLMQVEAGDREELAHLAKALRDFISEGSHSLAPQGPINQAITKLEEALAQGMGATDELLADVGELLGAAMEETDSPQRETSGAHKPVSVAPVQGLPRTEEGAESLPADADATIIAEFITESGECIQGAEAALLTLETNPQDTAAVNTVFRAFHTIKGTSAFLGLSSVAELAHRAESLLSRVRDGEIRCTGGYADLALRSADMLKALLRGVQEALSGGPIVRPDGYDELSGILADPEAAGVSHESTDVSEPLRLGDILVAEGGANREDVEAAAAQGLRPIGEALVKSGAATATNVVKAIRTQQQLSTTGHSTEDSSVRVRTDRLDLLIDTVGELVIAQSMVAQDDIVVLGGHHALSKKVVHLGKIVRDLQQLSMSMRMVPLKMTFQKMARMVRDLAHKNGKMIEFITEGEDTEIDRNMVDLVNDPLVHMVRNAVDHGIEPPDIRQNSGKPNKGTVRLLAYHSGGNVVVEMRDDGKGLSRDRIAEKAIQRGLISSDKGMSDNDVYNLIFAPGFSTAERITEISGRGVGLDVVKRNIEALRGRVEVSSELGKGCSFLLRLPLTMAVTDGMLIKVGAEQFIVPTINIRLSFRPEPDALSMVVGRGEMVMLRGELMPIFRLHKLFDIRGAKQDPMTGLLVVVDDGEGSCALLVDEIVGQQHVVARSLGDGIGNVQGVSGGAILGDGRVGLILDPIGVVALARQQLVDHRQQQVGLTRAA